MKKKINLFIITIVIGSLSGYSQTLSNTTWKIYNTSNTFWMYFHFGIDTASISSDNINYNDFSTFHENGNNITIIDIPGSGCSVNDTGRYTFSIQNDTLKFALVSDVCSVRYTTLLNYHWISLQSGIQSVNLSQAIELYPNPASNEIFVKSEYNTLGSMYYIFDQLGRQVLTGKLLNETTAVNITNLMNGVYFFKVREQNNQSFRLIKK